MLVQHVVVAVPGHMVLKDAKTKSVNSTDEHWPESVSERQTHRLRGSPPARSVKVNATMDAGSAPFQLDWPRGGRWTLFSLIRRRRSPGDHRSFECAGRFPGCPPAVTALTARRNFRADERA
jgi:hypothetical protein